MATYTMNHAERSWIGQLVDQYYPRYVDQRRILDKTGLSYPGWLKILNGSDIKVSTLIKICNGFNIPLEVAIKHEEQYLINKGLSTGKR